MTITPFQAAFDELKALGLVLRQEPGQYRVNFSNGTAQTEHRTDDLQAAVTQGRKMAAHPPPPTEPKRGEPSLPSVENVSSTSKTGPV